MPKGKPKTRKGVRGDKLLGVKARAKAKTEIKHKKYMAKLASHNHVKKTSKAHRNKETGIYTEPEQKIQ